MFVVEYYYVLPYVFVASSLLRSAFAAAADSSWHSSQTSLTRLYDLQAKHFAAVREYLNSESERLEELRTVLAEAYDWRDHKISDKNTYVHNHVNAVQTMRRIRHRLRAAEDLMDNERSMEALSKIDKHKSVDDNDVRLASRGLRRIQIFYKIPVSDLAAGKYKDRVVGDQMSACECYVMSIHCFEEHDMFGASNWAVQAYKTHRANGDQSKCVMDVEQLIFILVATSTATGFNFQHFLNSRTNHFEHTENFAQHFHLMDSEINFYPDESGTYLDVFDEYNAFDSLSQDLQDESEIEFRTLCYQHGESRRILTKDCVCQYQTKNSSYRILMPFKEENVHWDPYIKLYHDVIYDGEIERIKSICSNSLTDAKIFLGDDVLAEETRSGQVSWIYDCQAEGVLDSLKARIECLTGLSTSSAEAYQIVNYGLAGHYAQHYDPFDRHEMSDVQFDGSTTFPKLNVVSPARKGTALIWYNLHANNGSLNPNSLHGSCPILKGNKWIMTKWLYEEGQNLPYDWRYATEYVSYFESTTLTYNIKLFFYSYLISC